MPTNAWRLRNDPPLPPAAAHRRQRNRERHRRAARQQARRDLLPAEWGRHQLHRRQPATGRQRAPALPA
ncbi:MAG: hypothetical protein DI537_39410, partial [Stutzerimonas stutzeri]